ncbi:MAG: outer membrane receptor for ferrienterochelin and colicins [Marinoscillum sp.]|jgi:outer membrane receptor for ferrienterochelin and colicins
MIHLSLISRYLALLIFALIHHVSLGQPQSIIGSVMSAGEPVSFASIGLQGTAIGTTTGADGSFEIRNVSPEKYLLVVSSVGFVTQTKKVIVVGDTAARVSIDLKAAVSALDEVVITATMKEVSRMESPVPVEVYSDLFFKSNPAPSVFESLQNVNGVRPQLNCNVCNTGDIHINGLEGPYTMVLLDGMPIVSGLSTVYGLTGIPQSLVQRIEIVKGPASTLYGSEAVGGLINIITKMPESAPLVAVDIFTTDWQEINTDLAVKAKLGENADALFGINYFNYQNPIDRNGDGFTDLTLQNRISFFNKISFHRRDNKLASIAARYVYEDRWGGQMHWTKKDRGGREVYGESIYTNRWELFGTYQLPISENFQFQFSTNGHNQNSVYGSTIYIADQYIGFGQLTWNKPMNKHDILLGLTYRYTFYDDNTPATSNPITTNNQPSQIHLPGAFVQDEISLSANQKLLLGLRYDHNSLHGNILTPRVNYKWSTHDKMTALRVSIGNGYRVANVFTEDHASLTGARQVVFKDALLPETSWNANINVVKKTYTLKDLYIGLDASAFYTYFTNRILPDYESDPNLITYSNLDGFSVSKGISVNTDFSWVNGLKLLAGITVMDVSVTENNITRKQLLTESFQGVWSLGYTFNTAKLTIDYTGNLYGPMRLPLLGLLDDREAFSPWWSIQNIQITKKLPKGFEVYGGLKNLLNFKPPSNSIARAFDPFDKEVTFDSSGKVIATANNPNALTFDPTYVYASNQGIRMFLGLRYLIE